MDVTSTFRACSKTAATYIKAAPGKNVVENVPRNSSKETKQFSTEAKKIVGELSKVHQVLTKQRQIYFKVDKSSDAATSKILCKLDLIVHNVIQNCLDGIKNLKSKTISINASQQNNEHQQMIILTIEKYLQVVQKFFLGLKNTHSKKKKIFLELEPSKEKERKVLHRNESKYNSKIQEMNDDIREVLHYEDKISTQEDIQIFETENEQLHNELNTLSEDIKNIESKVTNITELQNFFTEKILGQDKNLENVLTTIVGSTEDVKEANEQIRKAIQRNAGLRVYVLFFLLVMSFTLIFLDWYNV